MIPFFDLIELTLQHIAVSVFNITFIIVIVLMYFMYNRNSNFLIYSLSAKKINVSSQMIESTLQGILIGVIGSFLVIAFGIPITLSPAITLLVPIALLLAMKNFRYLCFSYGGAVLGLIIMVITLMRGLGINIPEIRLDVTGIIALVGILHLMESILIVISGADDYVPIIVRRNGKISAGFLMQKFWPLPFVLLFIQLGAQNISNEAINMPNWWPIMNVDSSYPNPLFTLWPITAALGYGNISFSTLPEKKAKRSGLKLFIYSILLIVIAMFSVDRLFVKFLGIILMPLLHEIIILKEQKEEEHEEALFTLPKKGVRVVSLKPDGHGERMGLHSGDIIKRINGINIVDYRHLRSVLQNYYTYLWVEVEKLSGETKLLEYRAYPKGINKLDIVHLPQFPAIAYDLNKMHNTGLLNLFHGKK